MKKMMLALAVGGSVVLSGCSTFQSATTLDEKVTEAAATEAPIKEKTISSEWRDEGIKLTYTMSGELKEIEVEAQIPVYVASYKVVAESEARRRLVEFVHGVDVKSESRIEVIGNTMDKANDRASTTDGSSTLREAESVDKMLVEETRTITSSGRLVGWDVGGRPSSDGRLWIAKLKWSTDSQKVSEMIRAASK